MDLDSLKYADMQRLAKDVGLKANMKAEKLLKALKEYYQHKDREENTDDIGEVSEETQDTNVSELPPLCEGKTYVTKRRNRGQKAKRKRAEEEEDGAESDLNVLQTLMQTDEELGKPTEGQESSKRRRVSVEEDSGIGHPVVDGNSGQTKLRPSAAERTVGGVDQKPVRPAGKIPRHEGLLKKTTRPVLKPTTPNFKKLHEAHFNKMESIDSYVQRKNKQMEVLRNSVKELKMLSEKASILKPVDKKVVTKSNLSRTSMFSPATQERKSISDKRRLTQLSASKPALKNSETFKPTVLSTRRINVRFSQMTEDNEHKRSLVKTPARMSPHVELITTPKAAATERVKTEASKPAISGTKTPGATPFVFKGNTSMSSTPGTNKKNAFDLKASLSRPLTYQPHKGKLKPFGVTKENAALKPQTAQSHQKNYKQHQVQSRDERRKRHTEDRKQKKEMMIGARRGLVMA
ncbi:nucleolar and spindle-associated protein 1 isoform X1 [Megalops cyprinoides]|uniref:nucleolar and spindle-associated protein 1 isoform X1 n=1 Tax=Megalops cyprinoides TaxID=118141 RepID=UPI0018654C22|nr:nucleolar and spindle-associated protein 1 isoform X1 [Megalops cyprinoides]